MRSLFVLLISLALLSAANRKCWHKLGEEQHKTDVACELPETKMCVKVVAAAMPDIDKANLPLGIPANTFYGCADKGSPFADICTKVECRPLTARPGTKICCCDTDNCNDINYQGPSG